MSASRPFAIVTGASPANFLASGPAIGHRKFKGRFFGLAWTRIVRQECRSLHVDILEASN